MKQREKWFKTLQVSFAKETNGIPIKNIEKPLYDKLNQDSKTIFTVSASNVYSSMKTSPEGLSETEAADRLRWFGTNTIDKVQSVPLYRKFLANFTHLMALLLWAGGIAAFLGGMPQLTVAIWLVNIINGVFSFWQEFRAEKAIGALRNLLPQMSRVIRDNAELSVSADDLVPGDILLISEGDRISADARVIEDVQLRIDQSILTGESEPVEKTSKAVSKKLAYNEMPNLIFAGTNVAAGHGRAIVISTGMKTQFGKIATLTQSLGDELSPLQREIQFTTKIITIIAVAAGAFFFLLAMAFTKITMLEGFIFALGIIVAFVPEGLLPTMTLALAIGTQRMAKRNALIKKLSAVETLGCTSAICSDKTGTLTKNEMTVHELWTPSQRSKEGLSFTVSGVGYNPDGKIFSGNDLYSAKSNKGLSDLLLGAVLCNNSYLIPPNDKSFDWNILGDPTEAAMMTVARKGMLDIEAEQKYYPRVFELPFDSRRKRMSTIHQLENGKHIAYIKGSPLEILQLSSRIQIDDTIHKIDDSLRENIISTVDKFARKGLRVLAVCKRPLAKKFTHYTCETVESDLIFLGLIAMMDPPRLEVKDAVMKCQSAGIKVIMITGDYGLTAKAIARQTGIIKNEKCRVVTGTDLETMDDQVLKEIMQSDVIFARVAPEHKLRVVKTLQELRHVVAVTGDGVNDAPALKKADIGIAMGIDGTDVAKEASDMILTDDNFASIVSAVEEGRAVYSNIKKFTTYIFTSNTPEAVPFILYVLSRTQIPLALNVLQILSIDLGTDMVPALALGAEAPEPGIMKELPRNLKEHLITWKLLFRAYIFLGLIQSIAAMAAFYFMYWTHGYFGQFINLPSRGSLYQAATAMTLSAVVATQIGNVFAQRTERISSFRINFFNNRLIWIGIFTELILVISVTYIPFLEKIFKTAEFPISNWIFLFAWTPVLLLADELRKWYLRRFPSRLFY